MKPVVSALLFPALMFWAGLAGAADTVTPQALADRIKGGDTPLIIDVRDEDAFLEGHIPGARLIPHDRMDEYTESLQDYKDQPIVLYCRTGGRSGKAAETLEAAGFERVEVMEGGFPDWREAGLEVAE